MTYLFPLTATILAFAVTYLTCIRPMRRGQHCKMSGAEDPALEAQIRQLREDIQLAQHELDLRETETPPGSLDQHTP